LNTTFDFSDNGAVGQQPELIAAKSKIAEKKLQNLH
jgi:hypothetical protein